MANTATRSRELDGLRGLAALAVVFYHFGVFAFNGGWLGVDLFFVISGYVVTLSILRREESGDFSTSEFFRRRFTRLMPVVIAAVIGVLVITIIDPRAPVPWLDLVGALTMTYNGLLEVLPLEGTHLIHIWSLAVEWHFYIVAGIVFVPLLRRSKTMFLRLVTATAVLVAIARLIVVLLIDDAFWAYIETPVRVDGLLLGVLIAFSTQKSPWSAPVDKTLSVAVPLAIVAALTLASRWGTNLIGNVGLLIPAFTLLAGLFVFQVRIGTVHPLATRILESKLCQWLGSRSYSLYVWHYIIGIGILAPRDETFQGPGIFLAQLGLSLIAAEISYRFVEMPFQTGLNAMFNARKQPPIPLPSSEPPIRRKPAA